MTVLAVRVQAHLKASLPPLLSSAWGGVCKGACTPVTMMSGVALKSKATT
jgi:hypothetical protein